MTEWSKVITESAMLEIDDIRLQEELDVSPALFFRKMSLYLKQALPLLNRPVELKINLQKGFVEPEYDEYEWTSTTESTTEETVIATGKLDYELCSIVQYSEDGTKVVRYDAGTYNSETGEVTMPIQEAEGIRYSFDFYEDGELPTLSPSLMRLFGLAIAIVWNERFFENSWLDLKPKIKDSSFSTINESNYMDKTTARAIAKRQAFNDELIKYEQEVAYCDIVLNKNIESMVAEGGESHDTARPFYVLND